MKKAKRLFYYLVLNILISACTTLIVLFVWQRLHPESFGGYNPLTLDFLTPTPPSILATYNASVTRTVLAATEVLTKYLVQDGDTLSSIAEQFGTTVIKLMTLNGIADANSLASGQEILVPAPTPTEPVELTGTPGKYVTPPLTGTPGTQVPAKQVAITNIFGAGDLPTERVRLVCKGQVEASLAGWKLLDQDGHVYTFPQLTLYPDGAVDVHTGSGVNDVTSLYWGLGEAVWTTGEIATLVDGQGGVISTYIVP
jgi:LysM repeat protein